MATTQRSMTAEELERLPTNGRRSWLIAGEPQTMSPGSDDHGRYAMRLAIPLGVYAYDRGLGEVYAAETGFMLARNPDTVLGADLAYLRAERVRPFGAKQPTYVEGPPDLAVEVISPGESGVAVREKTERWLAHDTSVALVIDGRRRNVRVVRPGNGPNQRDEQVYAEYEILSLPDLFAAWSLPVAALFADRPSRLTPGAAE